MPSPYETPSTADQIKSAERDLENALADPRKASRIDVYEERIQKLKRQLKKEKDEIKPHPALQFGPVQQTVAIMGALSLGLSVAPLPYQMIPFFTLFSRLTIVAIICLVGYTSIIYYGYTQAIARLPKHNDAQEKLHALLRKHRQERLDAWAHTRSHPSAFLTTRHAPPRLFPFPLGKSRPAATVKDELWWEGGNAPHVGHFNKQRLPELPGTDPDLLMKKVETSMEKEKQQKMWKKRIRTIQVLCMLIIVSFVNRNVAIAGLAYLIYTTFSTEIENMLEPPTNMEEIEHVIYSLGRNEPPNERAPRPGGGNPNASMSYIYDPTEAGDVKVNSSVPIVTVPGPVLMTSENHYYAGPGEQLRDPDK